MKIVLLIILFTTLNLFAQDDAIKKLFPGKWKMDNDKVELFEKWGVVNETELVGTGFSISGGEKIVSEIIYLKKFTDRWAYVAVPKNQLITLFPLVEHTNKTFVFENKEHDFPQRIIYEFHKGGKLTAAIEGNVNGEFKRTEFSFVLVEQ